MSETARTTGWAAIGFAIVYVGTFVSNMVLAILGPASGVRYKTPDEMIADRLAGDVGAIGFALMGATLIVVAIGLRRLVWGDESIVGTAASSVGVIAGAGLMLTGAAIAAARGFAANDLAATGADIAMQRAVVQGGSLLVNAAFFLASLALLIWLSSVAVAARREASTFRAVGRGDLGCRDRTVCQHRIDELPDPAPGHDSVGRGARDLARPARPSTGGDRCGDQLSQQLRPHRPGFTGALRPSGMIHA